MSAGPYYLRWDGTAKCLRPAEEYTELLCERWWDGDMLKAERITKPRSLPQHNYYWGMLGSILKAKDIAMDVQVFHQVIKRELGLMRAVTLPSGKVVWVEQSTEWSQMDMAEFGPYLNRVIAWLAQEFGIDVATLWDMVPEDKRGVRDA